MSGRHFSVTILILTAAASTGCRLSIIKKPSAEDTIAKNWEDSLFSLHQEEPSRSESPGPASLQLRYFPVSEGLQTHNFITLNYDSEYIAFEACQEKPARICIADVSFETLIYLPPFPEGRVRLKARACEETFSTHVRESECGPWESITFMQKKLPEALRSKLWKSYFSDLQVKGTGMALMELLSKFVRTDFRQFDSKESPEKIRLLKKMILSLERESRELALLSLIPANSSLPWEIVKLTTSLEKYAGPADRISAIKMLRPEFQLNLEILCQGKVLLNYCQIFALETRVENQKPLFELKKVYGFSPSSETGKKGFQAIETPATGTAGAWSLYHSAYPVHHYITRTGSGLRACPPEAAEQLCSDPLSLWSLAPGQLGSLKDLNKHIIFGKAILILLEQLKKERLIRPWYRKITSLYKKVAGIQAGGSGTGDGRKVN